MRIPASTAGRRLLLALACGVVCHANFAAAWGSKAELAIVNTAMRIIGKEANLPLKRLEKELRDGAIASDSELRSLMPGLATGPLRAIEDEIALLVSMRGEKIDPYFAYRLGALGKVVAQALSPMASAAASARTLYAADVEKAMPGVALKPSARKAVEASRYFPPLLAAATANDRLIEREYQSGGGFAGIAATQFSEDVNRAIAAVADVWYTVLMGAGRSVPAAESLRRDYALRAWVFYIQRGNTNEIDALGARLAQQVPLDTPMRVAIGDAYYEAKMTERAMKEYESVLAADPGRKEVAERIAMYYVDTGNAALQEGNLELARDQFALAVHANPLHPDAERMRLDAEAKIADRDKHMAADQATVERGEAAIGEAEKEALAGRFAEAVGLLHQAEATFKEISDTFPDQVSARERGLREVAMRVQDYRGELVNNTQRFSGYGAEIDRRSLAAGKANDIDRQVLRSLAAAGYKQAMEGFAADHAAKMSLRD